VTAQPAYDIAVIGYGPTGVTAANLLGQFGLKVLVVERDADIYSRARAISTDEEVMRIWQQVGLADRVKQDTLADRPLTFVDAAGRSFIELDLASHACGHPPQQFIYQPALERVLRAGADRFPNVDVLVGHECLRLVGHGDGVELMLADLTADVFKRVRASYVIAADGGSSPTRGQLGIGYSGRTYTERWVVIDTKVKREWSGHDRLRFHCNPDRPTVDCPTPLGHHRWEYPARASEDDNELIKDEAIWRVLNDQGITDDNVEILRAVIYRHHVRVADRWRVDRVFLAGDAAHAMPPWIGQGMSAGVRDVANLCWKLAAVVTGQAPDSLLDSYQAERMPHVQEVTKRAVIVGRIITERNRLLAATRNHAMRALARVPHAARMLHARLWIPEARYRDGFFTGEANQAVGRHIPQPWVIDEHCARRRLDDVLGQGWAVLHTGVTPAGVDAWSGIPLFEVTGPGSKPAPGQIVDTDGSLTDWLRRKRARAIVIRPDKFVYTAADTRSSLSPLPADWTLTLHTPERVEA
jgi:3-(3-hydroxy-phenyl)propionate hydroxylase